MSSIKPEIFAGQKRAMGDILLLEYDNRYRSPARVTVKGYMTADRNPKAQNHLFVVSPTGCDLNSFGIVNLEDFALPASAWLWQ
jgi:hypothetical protein